MITAPRQHLGPVAFALGNLSAPDYVAAQAETAWLTRASAATVQSQVQRRLHRYLQYCLAMSPFWQARWPARHRSFRVEEAEEVLAALPPLTKEDLRAHGPALRIEPARRRAGDGWPGIPGQVVNRSGGSTGVPTEVWQDARYAARNRAVIDHAYRSVGLIPGRPTFYLWGSNNELSDLQATWKKRASTWARGLIALPSFRIDAPRVREYAARMRSQPEVDQALCFVHALDSFVRVAEREGIALPRMRRVVTGGGKLHPDLRALTRKLFADDVYEIYGGRDIGFLGVEAVDHQGMALFPWHTYVEVLRDGQRVADGATGEVHVTCVQNYSTALIRLALGDVARFEPARGDHNRPRIADVLGRSAEHLVSASGARVDPAAVVHLIGVLEARPWTRRFQLEQTAPDAATLRLEVWHDPGPEALEALRTRVATALGGLLDGPLDLRLEVVDAIAPAPSGKHFYVKAWAPPT